MEALLGRREAQQAYTLRQTPGAGAVIEPAIRSPRAARPVS
jgi:hypothetical protein